MAWLPISGIVPQATENGNQANGMVLKFYEPGTLDPLALATDNTGATQTVEFILNTQGYTTLSGVAVIPHSNQIYKVALYLDQADADADDTGSAVFVVDDVDMVGSLSDALDDIAQIDIDIAQIDLNIKSASIRPLDGIKVDLNMAVGDFAESSEYVTGSGSGPGLYEKILDQLNVEDGFQYINTTDGNQLKLIFPDIVTPYLAGVLFDGSDEQSKVQAILDLIGTGNFSVFDGLNKEIVTGSRLVISSKSHFEIRNLNLFAEDGRPVVSLEYVLHALRCTNFKYSNCFIDANRDNRTPAEVTAHSYIFDSCSHYDLEMCTSENSVVDGFHMRSVDDSVFADHNHDVVMTNCHSNNSFRQGMSLIEMHNMLIDGGSFTNTNGAAPAAGIDLESNAGVAVGAITNITINNVMFTGNEGFGVKIVASNDTPDGITIEGGELRNNILGAIRISATNVTVKDLSCSGFTDSQERGMIDIPADTSTKNVKIDHVDFSDFNASDNSKVCIYVHAVAGSDHANPNTKILNCTADGAGTATTNIIKARSPTTIDGLSVEGFIGDLGSFVTLTNSKIYNSTFTDCTGRAIFMNENCVVDGVTLKDFAQGTSSNALIHTNSADTNWKIRNVFTSHAVPITRIAIEIEAAGFELVGCDTNDDGGIIFDGTAVADAVSFRRGNTVDGVRITESIITP